MATVWVIEDNPVNMKLAVLLLHKAGHTVLCAVLTGAHQAVEHGGMILVAANRGATGATDKLRQQQTPLHF